MKRGSTLLDQFTISINFQLHNQTWKQNATCCTFLPHLHNKEPFIISVCETQISKQPFKNGYCHLRIHLRSSGINPFFNFFFFFLKARRLQQVFLRNSASGLTWFYFLRNVKCCWFIAMKTGFEYLIRWSCIICIEVYNENRGNYVSRN